MNLFRRKQVAAKLGTKENSAKPVEQTVTTHDAVCNPPCIKCQMQGCCLSCALADDITAAQGAISLWCTHDQGPSIFSQNYVPGKPWAPRKYPQNAPALPTDKAKPCPQWKSKPKKTREEEFTLWV